MTNLATYYEKERCLQRNRVAALRHGLQTATFRFLRTDELPVYDTANLSDQAPLQDFAPRVEAERMLKASLPEDATVYTHYMEAANDNFIGDRFMFLAPTTLKNIAADAQAGFAFMNSHRTGGMSHPAELPFGKTFYGAYQTKEGRKTAQVGIYMVGGLKPNGENGPTTDDFHTMIDTGIVADVSVGLYEGWMECDVCKVDYSARGEDGDYLCNHYPGSTYGMSKEQVQKQKDKGVPGGACSLTYHDARCGEVSGVFDGAVPGAGFQRLHRALKAHVPFSPVHRQELFAAYGPLLRQGEFSMDEHDEQVGLLASALRKLGFGPRPLPVVEGEPLLTVSDRTHLNAVHTFKPDMTAEALQSQLEAQKAEIEALKLTAAKNYVQGFAQSGHIKPAQVEAATKLYLASPEAFQAFVGEQVRHPAYSGEALLSAEELADHATGSRNVKLVDAEEAYSFRRQMNLTGGRN